MELKEFLNKVKPHTYQNAAPPFDIESRHLWESMQLFSVIDCLNDNCSILDYGCGGKGTLQHTLFSHYPNAKYYGLDINIEGPDNSGFNETKLNNNLNNVYFEYIDELENVLPKVDAMVMGSVFTHLSLNKMTEVLDKLLPHFERGFQLGFTTFLGEKFEFEISGVYGNDPETYGYTIIKFEWYKEYCDKNNLEIVLHPYFYKLPFELANSGNKQRFITIKKRNNTINIREMVEFDLSFFSEVRNECAVEFLHDSRVFNLEQTTDWFLTTKPNYYIIEYNDKKIGYFRTSNYNSEENSIYIGCDIHIDYRGKGLAYESYLKFIPFISKKFNIKTINLEVISTNIRAKNLYKKLNFVFNPDKSKTILKNNNEVLSEFWSLKNYDVCYVISLFFGNRRNTNQPFYDENRICFLEKHIEFLSNLKHNLKKIIFNINLEDGDYENVNKALKIIPKNIKNSEVEVRLRKNIGMSYGAWSDCFLENKDKYDYFIFNEDDYFFVIDDFDKILVDKFNDKGDAGYLCGIIIERNDINQPLHSAHSTGISSNEVLSKVFEKYGELPHSKSNNYEDVETNSQVKQTNVMIEMGYKLYDLRDEFKINFDYTGNITQFFSQNNKIILEPWKLVV
jgi:RimJ/RimL family protein N-acetyltransferase